MSVERIDAAGHALAGGDDLLADGEALHRAFRPNMGANYHAHMTAMFAEGAGLIQLADEDKVCALAVWRAFHTTYCGYRLEIDDLVTDETQRSKGYGATLLAFIEAKARAMGCDTLTLNSGTHRTRAHAFYFREGLHIHAFHFTKGLRG
ncbi:GNAT family N-acetyltransferase [Sphingomonas crusticola]|uniref:GNAT family N-acetyltransferase n=1 Tax=Sphingomonas crusticola TaxID=1697973 RepID=UPI0019682694|nr:GNAT family N-acetyltransferase [Sphingomonas crusticola]